ncbi:helix-turn-helix domain-containing protein [Microvirga alba]|uniref:Helix-turn-helix transcriptional regulator n=1 Tax=Microvirga alba TaxID=2791025 RepID=A0A931BTC1_9HYPH|nr:AraC family transcriptional regulator [Microvirga alba]MBF9232442.1 helix-turn-helix transcriptional regulator [Microvirga alba]
MSIVGRIVLWEGASLWTFDVPPSRGEGPTSGLHAHHAIQLTLSAGGRFAIRTKDGRTEGPAVFVAPDVPHEFEPEGKIALVFVEPESRAGAALMQQMNGAPVTCPDIARLEDALAGLMGIWTNPQPDNGAIEAIGRKILENAVGEALPPSPLDPRIARMLVWLVPRLRDRVELAEAAAIACLSESRFSHLFSAEIGLPFRTYVLWRRLMLAVEWTAAGSSLTTAAHEAGFADSAHFSRTFRRMFGLPAASLRLIQAPAR